jgi:uncharacterized protein YndB with AHSA1/START domain
MSFDFEGTYTDVKHHSLIEYILADDRKVKITFEIMSNGVVLTEQFDPETENPEALQQQGWQSILDNFKKYVENSTLKN